MAVSGIKPPMMVMITIFEKTEKVNIANMGFLFWGVYEKLCDKTIKTKADNIFQLYERKQYNDNF